MRRVTLGVVVLGLLGTMIGAARGGEAPAPQDTLDLTTFLERLVSVDHLPRPIEGKTEMASTWDRTGGNGDGLDFKRIEGDRNILLDVDGPGCVHRIFTGMLGKHVAGTQIRVFLDGAATPTFDMPVEQFFDDKNGPIPYPLVFHKTYPGTLFPIPFAKHCRIELVSAGQPKNWGNYWQVTYTRYAKDTPVETLRWPLSAAEKRVLDAVCQKWLQAESGPPEGPPRVRTFGTANISAANKSGTELEINQPGSGVISELRVHVSPSTPEVLGRVKLQIFWDGDDTPAVDVPIGYFFGNIATGYKDRYSSLLLGVDADYAYCRFPMPFGEGATIRLQNDSGGKVAMKLSAQIERAGFDTSRLGRFRATLAKTEVEAELANRERLPRFGPKKVPVHKVLDLNDTWGKYVGVFLHIDWPSPGWWGEGDWLIWADEDGWPPAYHGTGSEEYFNSGWCLFDRKAVSGIIRAPKMRPGHVGVYSFHLNDAFPFEKRFRIVEEIMPGIQRKDIPAATWWSTAFWYEFPSRK